MSMPLRASSCRKMRLLFRDSAHKRVAFKCFSNLYFRPQFKLNVMVADLCHVVLSCFRPATRKYATFHALRFRLLFVVSLTGEAKGRHAKTRQNHHFGGFSRGDLSRFRPEDTFIRHGINQPPLNVRYAVLVCQIDRLFFVL